MTIWLGGGQPVGLVRNNTLYWIHADHLGRPEMATNASQQRVWRAANWAFNRGIVQDSIGGYNLGFPGQYYDAESNLWHNGFRDYEPTLGRYMQSDPIGLVGGTSTFGYVGGNPVGAIDPLGLIDHNQCETRLELLKVLENIVGEGGFFDAIPGVRAMRGFNGHTGGGKFDYKLLQEEDTFNVNGRRYSAAAFGNFAAGYAGEYFGLGGYTAVRAGGIFWDYVDGASNWDLDSVPDINAGSELARGELESGKLNSCGCELIK